MISNLDVLHHLESVGIIFGLNRTLRVFVFCKHKYLVRKLIPCLPIAMMFCLL